MFDRVKEICLNLAPAAVFADIGCDHGFMTKYMLENDLCERAYVSDISAKSLQKAELLLAEYVAAGRCIPVVANGLEGIPERCSEALIAGMGGEEIVKILSKRPLPERFVLQPMKNADKVRLHLIERGAGIERDYTFGEDKFYDLIVGTAAGGSHYSEKELMYGRDNLRNPTWAFLNKLLHDANNLRIALAAPALSERRRVEVRGRLREIEVITDEIKGLVSGD